MFLLIDIFFSLIKKKSNFFFDSLFFFLQRKKKLCRKKKFKKIFTHTHQTHFLSFCLCVSFCKNDTNSKLNIKKLNINLKKRKHVRFCALFLFFLFVHITLFFFINVFFLFFSYHPMFFEGIYYFFFC